MRAANPWISSFLRGGPRVKENITQVLDETRVGGSRPLSPPRRPDEIFAKKRIEHDLVAPTRGSAVVRSKWKN